LTQVDEVRSGDSYLSHSDWRLHFGLASATGVDEIIIRWPNGAVDNLSKIRADQVVRLVEGRKPKR
jgi:hypothetical protein